MKKIVSFSLWGEDPKYTIGAIENAKLVNEIYQGWIGRFYCGKSVPENIINSLKNTPNTEVIIMDEDGDWTGMFWRFLACKDGDVMISRDTDSRLSLREKLAVDEWLKSDKNFKKILLDCLFSRAGRVDVKFCESRKSGWTTRLFLKVNHFIFRKYNMRHAALIAKAAPPNSPAHVWVRLKCRGAQDAAAALWTTRHARRLGLFYFNSWLRGAYARRA